MKNVVLTPEQITELKSTIKSTKVTKFKYREELQALEQGQGILVTRTDWENSGLNWKYAKSYIRRNMTTYLNIEPVYTNIDKDQFIVEVKETEVEAKVEIAAIIEVLKEERKEETDDFFIDADELKLKVEKPKKK